MSIARQRREGAAALAILMREKLDAMEIATLGRDDETMQKLVVELALLQQNNARFLLYVLEQYAGTIAKLPGGLKRQALVHGARMETHESLAEAVISDNDQ